MTVAAKATLAEALVAAQSDMPKVEPDATNPHFRSKFVSLDHLIAKTRPVLNKHGLAITQWPTYDFNESGVPVPTLRTVLSHLSGERMESTMPLLIAKNDMQGLGGAITYARRYAWAAALGIASEADDDGQSISGSPASTSAGDGGGGGSAPAATPKPKNEESPVTAEEQKKLDRLIANLSRVSAKDWDKIAESFSREVFGHGRDQVTKPEMVALVKQLTGQLDELDKAKLRELQKEKAA